MKDKQNSNIETQETYEEEDNLEFFYNKIKMNAEQEGGNKTVAIVGGILGGVALIAFIVYKIIKKKPQEVEAIASHTMEIEANLESMKSKGIKTTYEHRLALESTSIPPPDIENDCEQVEQKFDEKKIQEYITNEGTKEKERIEKEEANKKKEEAAKKEKEKGEKKEEIKGGAEKGPVTKLKYACEQVKKANKKETEPSITNPALKDIIEYNLLEGPVMKIIYQDIVSKAKSGKISPVETTKILQDIKDTVEKNFKKYKKCNFANAPGDFRIEEILNEKSLSKIIINSIEKIENVIESFTIKKIYSQLGITKDTRNVCKSLPVATLFGIPRLTHKTLKGLEIILKKKKFKNTSKIIGNAENQLCVDLLEAVINDLLGPIKKKMIQQIGKIKIAFNTITSKNGGALIGEGVYGCVFRPHLH